MMNLRKAEDRRGYCVLGLWVVSCCPPFRTERVSCKQWVCSLAITELSCHQGTPVVSHTLTPSGRQTHFLPGLSFGPFNEQGSGGCTDAMAKLSISPSSNQPLFHHLCPALLHPILRTPVSPWVPFLPTFALLSTSCMEDRVSFLISKSQLGSVAHASSPADRQLESKSLRPTSNTGRLHLKQQQKQ
jgi:hypothetical protein